MLKATLAIRSLSNRFFSSRARFISSSFGTRLVYMANVCKTCIEYVRIFRQSAT